MAFENTLYPYTFTIKYDGVEKTASGHASTAGLARQSIMQIVKDLQSEDEKRELVSFAFNGEEQKF